MVSTTAYGGQSMFVGFFVAFANSLNTLAHHDTNHYTGQRTTPHHQTPATFAVNILGSLLLGLLVGIHPHNKRIQIMLGIGFLGTPTTPPTLAYQTYHYLDTP